MQVLTSELKSTQLIVKILQDELKSKVPEPTISGITTTCVNFKPQDTINSESESAWIEPRGNNQKAKLPKNTTRYLKHLTPHIHLGKNSFAPLCTLQEETLQPAHTQHKLSHLQKTKSKKQRKVILLGDSHIRGCAGKLADLLGNSYSVMGITKPNANTKGITDSLNLQTEKLTKKDVVILCSGTRDIAKNETNIGLRYISQFANTTATTNVIVVCAPTRFDLQPTSCVNKEVATFNRKLQKAMKSHSHVKL